MTNKFYLGVFLMMFVLPDIADFNQNNLPDYIKMICFVVACIGFYFAFISYEVQETKKEKTK